MGGLSSSINRYVQNGYQLPPHMMADDRDCARETRQAAAALKQAVNRSPLSGRATAASSGVPCKEDENEILIGPHQDFRVVAGQMESGSQVICLQSADTRPRRRAFPRPRQAPAVPGAAAA